MQKRKGVESFVIVLVAGITIFGIAMLLSVVPEDSKFRSESEVLKDVGFSFGKKTADGIADSDIIIFEANIGRLGSLNTKQATSNLGTYDVGWVTERSNVDSDEEAELQKGLFYGTKKLEYSFEGNDTTKAIMTFTVDDTNSLGPLAIVFNGNEAYSELTPAGTYEVELEDIAEGTNVLEITAKSPGFRFWASTVYQVSDVSLDIDKSVFKEVSVPFVVEQTVFERWVEGNLVFKLPELSETENLTVLINGNQIYNDQVYSRFVTLPFSKFENKVVPGENLVTFRTYGSGAYKVQDAIMNVEYAGGEVSATIKSFIIPEPIFASLQAGDLVPKITFDFKEISQSALSVNLNDRDYVFPNLGLQYPNGTAEIELTVNDLWIEFNIMKFRTLGVYDIFNLRLVGEVPAKSGFFK